MAKLAMACMRRPIDSEIRVGRARADSDPPRNISIVDGKPTDPEFEFRRRVSDVYNPDVDRDSDPTDRVNARRAEP
jgi:hypothetical protein